MPFVTFEGIEGCGKSTQARRGFDYLRERGLEPLLVREPGGTTIGGVTLRRCSRGTRSTYLCRMPSLSLTAASQARLAEEAVSIAATLLCHGHDNVTRCTECRRVFANSHPDFMRVEPDGVQIKVERVREALRFAVGRPYEAPCRVAWIDSADHLGEAAANA